MTPHRQGIQPLRCPACGSSWFRKVTFQSEPRARLQAPLIVCLCGTVVKPRLSGIRPPADQYEIDQLFAALDIVRGLRQSAAEAEVLAGFSAGATATLTSKIASLERSC